MPIVWGGTLWYESVSDQRQKAVAEYSALVHTLCRLLALSLFACPLARIWHATGLCPCGGSMSLSLSEMLQAQYVGT
jgi:hypothetical protein